MLIHSTGLAGVAWLVLAGAPPAPPPDLSGTWTYNVELSDGAREKMREAGERGGSGGGRPPKAPGGGGFLGGPGGGRPGRGTGSSGGGDDAREAMRAIFEPAERLAIRQTPAEIEVDEEYGRLRRLHPDGKEYKTDNGNAEVTSSWKDGQLQVATRRQRGASVVETWAIDPDGRRLVIDVRLTGGPGPAISLRRVYDRAAAGGEPPAK